MLNLEASERCLMFARTEVIPSEQSVEQARAELAGEEERCAPKVTQN